MLPQNDLSKELDFSSTIETSRTYRMDFENKRILGFVDEKEAIQQFAIKTLSTERYVFDIYSDDIGVELEHIISGNYPEDIVESEIKRVIPESLIYDERVLHLSEIECSFDGDSAFIEFTISSIFGDVPISYEIKK